MADRLVMRENFEYFDPSGWSQKYYKHRVYNMSHSKFLPEDSYTPVGDKPDPEYDDLFPPLPILAEEDEQEPELVCEEFVSDPDDLLLDDSFDEE